MTQTLELVFSLDDPNAEDRYALEPVDHMTPEKLYDRRWALTLIEKVLSRLREEAVLENKAAQFEVLEPSLSGLVEPGKSFSSLTPPNGPPGHKSGCLTASKRAD